MISRKSAWRTTSATKITNSSRLLMNESGSSMIGKFLFQCLKSHKLLVSYSCLDHEANTVIFLKPS